MLQSALLPGLLPTLTDLRPACFPAQTPAALELWRIAGFKFDHVTTINSTFNLHVATDGVAASVRVTRYNEKPGTRRYPTPLPLRDAGTEQEQLLQVGCWLAVACCWRLLEAALQGAGWGLLRLAASRRRLGVGSPGGWLLAASGCRLGAGAAGGWRLAAGGWRLLAAGCGLRAGGCWLLAAGWFVLQAGACCGWLLAAAGCRLEAAGGC
jgi:hypothetical protein